MAQASAGVDESLVLDVVRRVKNRACRFRLIIPRRLWEDVLGLNAPGSPVADRDVNPLMAYGRAKSFWDDFAARMVPALLPKVDATDSSSEQLLAQTWPAAMPLDHRLAEFRRRTGRP